MYAHWPYLQVTPYFPSVGSSTPEEDLQTNPVWVETAELGRESRSGNFQCQDASHLDKVSIVFYLIQTTSDTHID